MTFYRVVLFLTASPSSRFNTNKSDNNFSPPPPLEWNPDCWPTPPQPVMLQMPLASMDRVEKSIYSTSQNTTLMGLIMHGKDIGRQLCFTTPSCADTLHVQAPIQTFEFFLRQIAESAAWSISLRLDAPPKPSREWIQKLIGQSDMGLTVDPGCSLKIMDMRPRASALANRTSGYGYENTSHCTGTTLQFCIISNIHSVRDSYTKMSSLCMSATAQDQNWNSLIEDTKWFHLIRAIWAAAWDAAFRTHVHRLPVLLHPSHGWDRTSQVDVLSQLLLHPYYRIRAGFAALVENDFLSFGHPLHTRCAHGEGCGSDNPSSNGTDEGQISHNVLQFLDCKYQLIKLFPGKI